MIFRKELGLFLLTVAVISSVDAQKLKKADNEVIKSLQSHVSYLADDKLQGRRAGSSGEKLAMDYIRMQFQNNQLAPKGDNKTYFQDFIIKEPKTYEASSLTINGDEIKTTDFFPFANSPEITFTSSPSIALKEAGEPWFLNIKEDLDADTSNVHVTPKELIIAKARNASKKGAKALFVYNTEESALRFKYSGDDRGETLPIPVIFVSPGIAKKYFSDESATLGIKAKIEFTDNFRTAHNILGYIDNSASSTVVLGAHYDHLGFGEDGNSLGGVNNNQIHNGADDNASGVAALIELSKLLKNSKLKNNNYLFIAFSGEEQGLLGSRYFVEHPTIDLSRVNYMINMDMIGRLNDSTKTLTVGGFGTSPVWAKIVQNPRPDGAFTIRYDTSGAGPSDHTSFYRKNIPVLFFFTGVHSDYHRPGDDYNKLNYTGEYRILQYIYKIIQETNTQGKLAFLKTREPQMSAVPTFTVGLGIMPDYSFSGAGVRIDGILEGRAAEKAGLKTGDVVIQLGDNGVSSMQNYMEALGTFKKGDKTKVKVKRAAETIEAEIIF